MPYNATTCSLSCQAVCVLLEERRHNVDTKHLDNIKTASQEHPRANALPH